MEKKYDINKLNSDEAKAFGLTDDKGQMNISQENIIQLERGLLTDDITLKNMSYNKKLYDIPAKLSLYEDENKELRIKVHPYYKENQLNDKLSLEENKFVMMNDIVYNKTLKTSGIIENFGKEKFMKDPKMEDSFFIELKQGNQKKIIWGKELEKTLNEAKLTKGDQVIIENTNITKDAKGNLTNEFKITENKNAIIEKDKGLLAQFDSESKQIFVINKESIPKIKAINGKDLSKEEQEELINGNQVTIDNTDKIQVQPKKSDLVISDKKLLIASLLLDGGISYALIKSAQVIQEQIEKRNIQQQLKSQENLVDIQQKEQLVKRQEEINNTYKEQLAKLEKQIKDVEMKFGSTPELKEVKTFVHKEQEIAEVNQEYQRPQNIVNAEDKYQQQEINLNEEEKTERNVTQTQEQNEEHEKSQSRGRSR